MTNNYKYLARITIEFITPFHVGSGQIDDETDSPVILDPNGLPTIPGSSIAGILRSEFKRTKLIIEKPELEDTLFEFQRETGGTGALLTVSWASIHDSNNNPIVKLIGHEQILKDDILRCAKDLPIRDHVRINHRGASDSEDKDGKSGHGKFDEAIVPVGNRFSFEMEMSYYNKEEGDRLWHELLNILHKPVLRFGGRTRRGLGAFKVVSCKEACFDLKTQLKDYLDTEISFTDQNNKLKEFKNQSNTLENYKIIALKLKPDNYWMFGGGIDTPSNNEKEAVMAPLKGKIVKWVNNHAELKEKYLIIPGSSIKGAISHRVAYYYNLLTRRFAENAEDVKMITGENNEAVKKLFGFCKDKNKDKDKDKDKDKKNNKEKDGARGKIIINDMFFSPDDYEQKLINHVSIDRFTGGAMPGKLFSERPVYLKNKNDTINLIIYVEQTALSDTKIKESLKHALLDLTQGRLQLGAGSGRGHGYFISDEPLQDF